MEPPSWTSDHVDMENPSIAQAYVYYLGGSHNFAVDRRMARRAIELWPELPVIMQANRAFLRRALYHTRATWAALTGSGRSPSSTGTPPPR